ncbi:glutamate 5-kinase [Bradymonas sediminis]|uniref:Glutamate 5-kinase n=1 Tax=Bradymonas sediminis TaxID=1548548 RepID=A0A2Z4FH85_9DELT|nr:glutamate 5-kinase [Bradymonas sediminis]AWV88362.1 glutamate 5-kinase [Bradymonas sediminis]TDP77489.1 glutamate 5-kinase [Bradymonas sediminis]
MTNREEIENGRSAIAEAEHWVVKLGSAVFLGDSRQLDRPVFTALIEDISKLLRRGKRVTLVSSGAVALGREHLGWPEDGGASIPCLQAYAAVGQSRLMQLYADEFVHHGHKIAQILFSRADLDARRRFLNARMTLERLHQMGVVPIINENDTVATEELRFGDNDRLAAMTCGVVHADMLVILSDVEGIFEVEQASDGSRKFGERIAQIEADDPHLMEIAGPSISGVGTGGMTSKVQAAQIAARMGVPTVIARGKRRGVLGEIADQKDVGTLIGADRDAGLAGKKVWLGTGARPVGRLLCDAGAVRALRERGASLLPSGVLSVEGAFDEGAVVELSDEHGVAFARGISVYGSSDIERIAGHHSDEIVGRLGFRILDTIVHRDGLVMI